MSSPWNEASYKYKLVDAVRVHKVRVRLRHCYFLKGGFAPIGGDRLITVILGARFSSVGIHKVFYRSGPYL